MFHTDSFLDADVLREAAAKMDRVFLPNFLARAVALSSISRPNSSHSARASLDSGPFFDFLPTASWSDSSVGSRSLSSAALFAFFFPPLT